MTEKEKVVPSASVGTDAGRPIPYKPEPSIAENPPSDKKNFSEVMQEYNTFTQLHNPDRLQAVTISELMEEELEARPPFVDGLLYSGVYMLAGAEKIIGCHSRHGCHGRGGLSQSQPRRAQSTFDAECQKCFCVTFAESNKGWPLRGVRKFNFM